MAVRSVIHAFETREQPGVIGHAGAADQYRRRLYRCGTGGGSTENHIANIWDPNGGMAGSGALRTEIRDNGNPTLGGRYYNFSKSADGSSQANYLRYGADDELTWQFDTYNRLVFFMKPPAELPYYEVGGRGAFSFTFGGYTRTPVWPCSHGDSPGHGRPSSNDESNWTAENHPQGNTYEVTGHSYHTFRHMIPGVWNQYIVDWHPNTWRNQSGNFDFGSEYNLEYIYDHFEGVADQNFFDVLSYYYLSGLSADRENEQGIRSFPSIWYLDSMICYAEEHANDLAATDDVYTVCGAYDPNKGTTGEVGVSWSVRTGGWMADNGVTPYPIDVKWATTDIHTLGWDNATDGPIDVDTGEDGIGIPNINSAYNMMQYRTQGIDPGGADFIYIGIRRQDAAPGQFRQIVLPTDVNGGLPPHLVD